MDEFKQEIEDIRAELPDLGQKVKDLQDQLALEQRKTLCLKIYKQADPDVTVSFFIDSFNFIGFSWL